MAEPEHSASAADGLEPRRRPVLPGVIKAVSGVLFTLTLTFIGLTAVTFVIGRVMPADPVLAVVGDRAPEDVYQKVYREMQRYGIPRTVPEAERQRIEDELSSLSISDDFSAGP